MPYPIIYTKGFVLAWGLALGISLIVGGLLSFASVAFLLLILVHHEHAHLVKCQERGAAIHGVTFTAMGGMVEVTAKYPQDTIDIHKAGVYNSAAYAIATIVLLSVSRGYCYSSGLNLADPMPGGLLYYFQFMNTITLMACVLVITNILPISIPSRKYGIVTTDGWAAVILCEQRDELWNDGRQVAISLQSS